MALLGVIKQVLQHEVSQPAFPTWSPDAISIFTLDQLRLKQLQQPRRTRSARITHGMLVYRTHLGRPGFAGLAWSLLFPSYLSSCHSTKFQHHVMSSTKTEEAFQPLGSFIFVMR